MFKVRETNTHAQDEKLKYDVSSHFGFGSNWRDYLSQVTDSKLQKAEAGLQALLGKEASPIGKSFIDIGSGSGVHSLAALRMGVRELYALDFDPNSVHATREALANHWKKPNYSVDQGNILLLEKPEKRFDVVYSWGVLHHTGDMWTAIRNACAHVNDEGHLAIAIYQKTPLCGMWKVLKSTYVKSPWLVQRLMEKTYSGAKLTAHAARGENPIKILREYEGARGMIWRNDVVDWIGGWPYESATPAEIINFVEKQGFKFVRGINTEKKIALLGLFGSGCSEFLFKRVA